MWLTTACSLCALFFEAIIKCHRVEAVPKVSAYIKTHTWPLGRLPVLPLQDSE